MENETKTLNVGDAVKYVDPYGVEHDALLTAVHGSSTGFTYEFEGETRFTWPCVNLLYVTKEENKSDPYGRQILRESSVAHQGAFAAHGRYYTFYV